jgi:neutral ceramidase
MIHGKFTCTLAAVGLLMVIGGDSLAADRGKDSPASFRAGACVVDTTPPQFPVSLVGSFTDRKAASAHDPLAVRCLVLDDGKQRVAIAVVDVCILPRELCDEAKRLASKATGIRPDHILIASTHTHSAPPTMVLNDIPLDPAYPEMLTRKISEGIEKAAGRLVPVKPGWGVTQVPDEVFNRRWFTKEGTIPPNPFGKPSQVQMNPGAGNPNLDRPAGPTDPDVSVLSLQSPAGQPVALLANYSLHYVGDVPAGMLSADYFGEFCRQVESRLAGSGSPQPPVAILSNGTSGDVNNINFRSPRKRGEVFSQIRHVAGKIADAALKVYGQAEHRDGLSLVMKEKEIELAVRKPSGAELEQAKRVIATPDDKGLPRLARYYAQQAVRLSQFPDRVKIKIQALRIGELGIVAIPCEVFAEIGLEIKRRSPLKPTFIIDLANGYHGYLPSPEQHALGGYETWPATSSYLETNASRKIVSTAIELLDQVKRDSN